MNVPFAVDGEPHASKMSTVVRVVLVVEVVLVEVVLVEVEVVEVVVVVVQDPCQFISAAFTSFHLISW